MEKSCGVEQKRAAWIYYQLRLQKTSAAAVGRTMQPPVSKRLMSYVINGQGAAQRLPEVTVQRVQKAVAAALGMSFEQAWGKGAPAQRRPGAEEIADDRSRSNDKGFGGQNHSRH